MLYFNYNALDGWNYGCRHVLLWARNIVIVFKIKICIKNKSIAMFIDISVSSTEQKYHKCNHESNRAKNDIISKSIQIFPLPSHACGLFLYNLKAFEILWLSDILTTDIKWVLKVGILFNADYQCSRITNSFNLTTIRLLRKTLYPIPFTALFSIMPQVVIMKFHIHEYGTSIIASETYVEGEFE